jgi:hypothetical protein
MPDRDRPTGDWRTVDDRDEPGRPEPQLQYDRKRLQFSDD